MMQGLLWGQVLAVAVGAAAGALLRWVTALWLNASGSGLPLGTLLVNCLGGLLIGMLMVWFERVPNEVLRLLLVTGFLGGYTTFSSYAWEALVLAEEGAWVRAGVYVVGSNLVGFAGVWLGAALARLVPA